LHDALPILEELRKGDVITVRSGRRNVLAVVVDPGVDQMRESRPLVVTEERWAGRLTAADFPAAVEPLGRISLPKFVNTRSPKARRSVAGALRESDITTPTKRGRRRGSEAADDAELQDLRRRLKNHPCHSCAE